MTTPDKPCPFCGSAAERDCMFGGYVRCTSKTGCPLAYDGIAADHWNRRALASPAPNATAGVEANAECPTCGAPALKSEEEGAYDMRDVYTYAPPTASDCNPKQPAGEGGPKYSWGADGTVLADFTDDPGYWTTPEQPGSSMQGVEDAALLRMFRALVDAGGPTTIARHGVERGSDAWEADVRAGMLAIERRFHPERFDDTTPPPAPAVGRDLITRIRELEAERNAEVSADTDENVADDLRAAWRELNPADADELDALRAMLDAE